MAQDRPATTGRNPSLSIFIFRQLTASPLGSVCAIPSISEKLVTSSLLTAWVFTNAYGFGFGAAGPWWSCGEGGEFEASAGRGRFPVGSQVGRLAR